MTGWGRGHEILLALTISGEIKLSGLARLLASESLDSVSAAGIRGLGTRLGLDEEHLEAVRRAVPQAAELLRQLRDGGFGVLARCEPGYPALLREIHSPPPLVFTRGSLIEADCHAVAIVGSRRPSLAGARLARELAAGLAAAGLSVVSGLARGIDTAAHDGALQAGGRTIAVLGSGIDLVYPPENKGLAGLVAASGALVSELPPGAQPLKSHFPRRNRLISGLAMGTVVVEAGERSGALITAGFALDQNRTVFAVPGSPGDVRSRGANRLLKEGARLVETVDDILEDLCPQLMPVAGGQAALGLELPGAGAGARPGRAGAPGGPGDSCGLRRSGTGASAATVDGDDARVVMLLSDAPVHVDEIARALNLDVRTVLGLLLSLESRGFARSLPGKFYVKGGA